MPQLVAPLADPAAEAVDPLVQGRQVVAVVHLQGPLLQALLTATIWGFRVFRQKLPTDPGVEFFAKAAAIIQAAALFREIAHVAQMPTVRAKFHPGRICYLISFFGKASGRI